MTLRVAVTATAQAEVGTVEWPPGSNRTKYGAWYGLNGVPWCAIFVAWCYARHGHDLRAELTRQWAYTPAGFAAGRRAGWAVDPRSAAPGDVVFFNFAGGEAIDHVGIVTANLGARGVATVEGNTSSGTGGSQANGGGVYARTRPWSVVAGVLSAPYLADAPPPPRPLPPTPPPLPTPAPPTTAPPEADMFLVAEQLGFFAVAGPVIVGLTMSEYADARAKSPGTPVLTLPPGPGKAMVEQLLKASAKAQA